MVPTCLSCNSFLALRRMGAFKHTFCDLQHFLDETKKHYSAGLEPADFKNNPEAAVVKINSWVEEQTQGMCHISLVLQQ